MRGGRPAVWCAGAQGAGGRYVYVTHLGPMAAEVSVEAAVDAYRRLRDSGGGSAAAPPQSPMGYVGPVFAVGSPVDSLEVLPESVGVAGGVLRGLAQNRSRSLWARNVVVKATDPAGGEGLWRFPLAVQPGEVLPFEIEHWPGTAVPSGIGFEVSAELSPTIDVTRSAAHELPPPHNQRRYRPGARAPLGPRRDPRIGPPMTASRWRSSIERRRLTRASPRPSPPSASTNWPST